jgi:diphthine-ammonia ligase
MYGAHPAGEGGEYETLTLDTPIFSHRINIKQSEVVITDPEPSLVAYLRIEDAELEAKEGWMKPTVEELRELLGLDESQTGKEGLDEQSCEIFDELSDVRIIPGEDAIGDQLPVAARKQLQFGNNGRWFSVSAQREQRADESVGDELKRSLDAVKGWLRSVWKLTDTERLSSDGLSLPLHAAHITLLLSSMSDFPAANSAYIQYFGTSPPSRACVAVPLPEGERIRVDIVGFDDKPSEGTSLVGGRSALHVQGMSYWAPANIGPYSQAVTVNSRLHIAGQIPLQPVSLTFAAYPPPPASPYVHQATLALQHVRRIVEVLRSPNSTGGGWTGWGESCVAWWARPSGCGTEGPSVAQKAWTAWSSEVG